MDKIGLPLTLITLLVILSGYFTLIETALTESHRSRMEKLTDDEKILNLIESPDKSISAAKILIVLSAIFAGVISTFVAPIIFDFMGLLSSTIVTTLIVALIILFFGRLLPQKFAMQSPEKYVLEYKKIISFITFLMLPLILTMTKIVNGLMMLFGMNAEAEDTVTEDEVKDLIEQGREAGTFEREEQAMVDRIFQLGDETAYSLMTPRTQIVWLDLTDSLKYNLKIVSDHSESILPVGEGSLDNCRGVLYAKDLLDAALSKDLKSIELDKLLKKPMYVPRSMEAFRLLEKFRNTGVHEAMVLDEYGGVTGFITLNDLMYEIIGSYDDTDAESTQFSSIGKDKWFVDGLYYIDDFKKKFNVDELPDEEHDHFQTMGGFLTSYFGRIPNVGDKCEWNGFKFEVARMDRARIDKFYITKVSETVEIKN